MVCAWCEDTQVMRHGDNQEPCAYSGKLQKVRDQWRSATLPSLLSDTQKAMLRFTTTAGWRDKVDEDVEELVLAWAEDIMLQAETLKSILEGLELPVGICPLCRDDIVCVPVADELGDAGAVMYIEELLVVRDEVTVGKNEQ